MTAMQVTLDQLAALIWINERSQYFLD